MKIVLFIGVLIASVWGQAENRCAVIQDSTGYTIYNTTQDQRGYFSVTNFNDAISILQKMNAVGACSALTANCYIDESSGSYYLYNKVEGYSKFQDAFSSSKLDDVILAFDQLVKAGGCQP